MPKLKCKITGPTPLGEKRVGEEFFIDVDDEGTPLDLFWRNRFSENAHKKGFIEVMSQDSDASPAKAPTKSSKT